MCELAKGIWGIIACSRLCPQNCLRCLNTCQPHVPPLQLPILPLTRCGCVHQAPLRPKEPGPIVIFLVVDRMLFRFFLRNFSRLLPLHPPSRGHAPLNDGAFLLHATALLAVGISFHCTVGHVHACSATPRPQQHTGIIERLLAVGCTREPTHYSGKCSQHCGICGECRIRCAW